VTTSGVLVANKPRGVTSHDVVKGARRLFSTRTVGHSGTLDPMASGVLVLLVGEATKLAAYLTLADKEYRATVTFGRATDTLDAEGQTTRETELGGDWLDEERLAAALRTERDRTEQTPPAFSAISVGGERSYRRARRGEDVALAPRVVRVERLDLVARDERSLSFVLSVSKGYYVRSFARDLGEGLGLPAHLSALVRTASGSFRLDDATPWPPPARPDLIDVSAAARLMLPAATLTSAGEERALAGKKLSEGDFIVAPSAPAISAWFAADGRLVALGAPHPDGTFRVRRGFRLGR
jgi:tRNA pseudouridine55 synthase